MKKLRFLSVLLLLCFIPFCAFAMDMGLVDVHNTAKWMYDITPSQVFLDFEHSNCGLDDGFYQYYSDISNNCFYLRLHYTESSIDNNGDNNIYLHFNIENSSHNYEFNVDENFNDSVANLDVQYDFSGILGSGQDMYVGIEFLNKEDKKLNNTISFFLSVNDVKYYICKEDISLNYGDYAESLTAAKPTTTKQTTTKQPTTKKETTTKETTTKTTTTKPATTEKTTKATTTKVSTTKESTTKKETTTKFRYTGDGSEYFTEKQTTVKQEIEEQTQTTEQQSTAEKTTTEPTATTEKPAKETTTKFNYTGTIATNSSEKSTKSTTSGKTTKHQSDTTKFHYVPEESTTVPATQFDTDPIEEDQIENVQNEYIPPEDIQAEDYQNENENIIIIPETQNAESLSPQSKLLIALAVVFAVSGTALIVHSLSKKEKEDNEEQTEEQ